MEDDVYLKLIYNYFKECSAAILDLSSSKIILQDEMEKIVILEGEGIFVDCNRELDKCYCSGTPLVCQP